MRRPFVSGEVSIFYDGVGNVNVKIFVGKNFKNGGKLPKIGK